MPKNMRNFEVSSGSFSTTAASTEEASEADEGAVEAGDSAQEPEEVEAMMEVLQRLRSNAEEKE